MVSLSKKLRTATRRFRGYLEGIRIFALFFNVKVFKFGRLHQTQSKRNGFLATFGKAEQAFIRGLRLWPRLFVQRRVMRHFFREQKNKTGEKRAWLLSDGQVC